MNTKIIDKVKKMLALAGNNSSEQEAQNALLMAQKLMAQHNIHMEMVQDLEPAKKEVITSFVGQGSHTYWMMRLANVICKNFRTELLIDKGRKGLCFIGLKDDTDITVSVFNFAVDTLDKGMRKLRRDYRKAGKDTTGISGDYSTGFIKGLGEKFAEQVAKENWGLMLVKDGAVIAEKDRQCSGGTSKCKNRLGSSGDSGIFNQGYKAGKSLGLNKQLN